LLDAAVQQFGLDFGFLAREKIDCCFKGLISRKLGPTMNRVDFVANMIS
jgi:hypothetical protein